LGEKLPHMPLTQGCINSFGTLFRSIWSRISSM
jgi:hypothetical protein